MMITPTCDAEFEWRYLVSQEAALAYALHLQASTKLPAGWVRPDSLMTFEHHLKAGGLILGAFLGESLLAYGALSFQSELSQHLASCLGSAQGSQKLALLDGAACHPQWQRRHIHQQLLQQRLEKALQLGCQCIMATVSPHNLPSLRNLLQAGFRVQRAILVYQNLERLLLVYQSDWNWQEQCRVAVSDFRGHRSATLAGWQGFTCQREDEKKGWQICYGIPL